MITIRTQWSSVDRLLNGLKKELGNRGRYGAKAGYVKGEPHKAEKGESSSPATIDQIALYNEFGTTTIPPRPFLRNANNAIQEREREILKRGMEDEKPLSQILREIAEDMRNQIVESINSDLPPPNAESTVRQKHGSSHTLIDTGQLRLSVRIATVVDGKEKML